MDFDNNYSLLDGTNDNASFASALRREIYRYSVGGDSFVQNSPSASGSRTCADPRSLFEDTKLHANYTDKDSQENAVSAKATEAQVAEGPVDRDKICAAETRGLKSHDVLIGAALLGGGLSAASWHLDRECMKLLRDGKIGMNWWKPHSNLASKLSFSKHELDSARALNAETMKPLMQSVQLYSASQREFVALVDKSHKELNAMISDKKNMDLMIKQRGYIDSLEKKPVVEGSKIGSLAEVESGSKLFVRGTALADSVLSYERCLGAPEYGNLLKWYKSDANRLVDLQAPHSGKYTAITDSDIALKRGECSFLSKFHETRMDDYAGDPAIVAARNRLFTRGRPEAELLMNYCKTQKAHMSLLSDVAKSQSRVDAAYANYSELLAGAEGSLLRRTVCGTGRGLLFAAGAMTFGYVANEIEKTISRSQEKWKKDSLL